VRPAIAEVVAAVGEDEGRVGGDQVTRSLELLHRTEGIRRPLNEHDARADPGEMRGPQPVGTPGRMERIGEKEQAGDEIRHLGGEQAGLTATVGLAAEEHVLDAERSHRGDRMSQSGAIDRR
jgi:hypothetical protein